MVMTWLNRATTPAPGTMMTDRFLMIGPAIQLRGDQKTGTVSDKIRGQLVRRYNVDPVGTQGEGPVVVERAVKGQFVISFAPFQQNSLENASFKAEKIMFTLSRMTKTS